MSKTNEKLQIKIEDNGIGREQAAIIKASKTVEKESLGINLTKQRIIAYTEHLDGQVTIQFEDLYNNEKPCGTRVLINIPLQ